MWRLWLLHADRCLLQSLVMAMHPACRLPILPLGCCRQQGFPSTVYGIRCMHAEASLSGKGCSVLRLTCFLQRFHHRYGRQLGRTPGDDLQDVE